MSKTIIIGGDISPTNRDLSAFSSGDADALFGDVLNEIQSANYSIANLEFPIIDNDSPIQKSGAVFGAKSDVLNGIKNAGIDFLNLANNHIFDHGKKGLKSTLNHLESYKFDFAGAGFNRSQASEPFIKDIGGIKIGILTYCEAEFSVNHESDFGANHLDLIDFSYKVTSLKETVDFIILLYHGGKENYIYPTPQQRKNCKFFVDFGVNLVVCQHSHTIGIHEEYNNGHIFYGQGNFIFDPYPLKSDWLYFGCMIKVVFDDSGVKKIMTLPHVHNSFTDQKSLGIRLLRVDEIQECELLGHLKTENIRLSQGYIEEKWTELANRERNKYYGVIHGSSRVSRKINQKIGFLDLLYKTKNRILLKNMLTCETHLELIQKILSEDVSRINKK